MYNVDYPNPIKANTQASLNQPHYRKYFLVSAAAKDVKEEQEHVDKVKV